MLRTQQTKHGIKLGAEETIRARQSVRAFLSTPVPRQEIEAILALASCAPSGSNTQPWRVYVLQGHSLAGLISKVCAAHDALRQNSGLAAKSSEDPKGAKDPSLTTAHAQVYQTYYPEQWVSPYQERRRATGLGLYGLLGIAKTEKDRMHQQEQQNYRFFNAPVGLVFTLDKSLRCGSFLDCGMFLQTLMLAATARGLATCAQASWKHFDKLVLQHLGTPDNEALVCGMALGYPDPSQKINSYHPPRASVAEFTQWLD